MDAIFIEFNINFAKKYYSINSRWCIYSKYIIPPYAYISSCCVTYILDSSNFLAIFKVYLIEKRMNGRETLVFILLLFVIITELHPHSGVLIQNNNVSFCVWKHYVYHCERYFIFYGYLSDIKTFVWTNMSPFLYQSTYSTLVVRPSWFLVAVCLPDI